MLIPVGDSRTENLECLEREAFDLLVVGGGITGAGCALDAVSRGLKTALVEKADFASGTSSRSSKLVHGGIRYLARFQVGVTWEACHERNLLTQRAPYLVTPLPVVYPMFRSGRETRLFPSVLALYDACSGWQRWPRHRRARTDDLRRLTPVIDPARVVAAWTYQEAVTDDARLVLEVLRRARELGAVTVNYAALKEFTEDRIGRISGGLVSEQVEGRSIEVRARAAINATGIWAPQVVPHDGPLMQMIASKGIHLVVPAERFPVNAHLILPSAAGDGRSIYAVPWAGRVLLGTTDTEYQGPLESPAIERAEIDYLLEGCNAHTGADLRIEDVLAGWAGLRPLMGGAPGSRTTDLSRRHAVSISPSGVVSITGGKLTTYRRMSLDAVDAVCEALSHHARSGAARLPIGLSRPRAKTEGGVAKVLDPLGVDPIIIKRLVGTYGDRAEEVAGLTIPDPGLAATLSDDGRIMGAEVVWGALREMAVTLDDVLNRRTRLALTDRSGGLTGSAALAGAAFGWEASKIESEMAAYKRVLAHERGPLSATTLTGPTDSLKP
ncbi:MAG: FAD-dependent oxidoreductase [Acidimicrobiia bacterium]